MEVLVSEISKILSGGVVIATFDFAVAATDGGMDGLVGLSIEVAGEAVGCLAARASEAGGFAGVLLEVGRFVHNPGYIL